MIQFRKSKSSGPFRFTLSLRGLSTSFGGGPFRLSFGADGRARRTFRVPGIGLYDTKTIGGGRSRSRRSKRLLPFLAALFVFGLLVHACSADRPSPRVSDESTSRSGDSPSVSQQVEPWAAAPTDGVWPGDAYDRVPFGGLTPIPPGGAFTEFQFAVIEPPLLTTEDSGKLVTITSKLLVQRVEDKGFAGGISESQSFIFQPGTTSAQNMMDESHGTNPNVTCQNDRPRIGESTECSIAFTAPASEIPNSYWTVNRWDVGTWPSQR